MLALNIRGSGGLKVVETRFVQKLAALSRLDEEDRQLLHRLEVHPRHVRRGEDITGEGDSPAFVHMIQSGLACRYKELDDGRRQITAFLLPGDACDLQGFILRQMDHSVGVLSDADVIAFPRTAIAEMLTRPGLANALLKSVLIDEATLRQWIVNVARRPAAQSIAHLFCEMRLRLRMVGLSDGVFSLPITQEELGDTVGLSTVHVNRSLRDLRLEGLVDFQNRKVVIPDIAALEEFAEFDGTYLHL